MSKLIIRKLNESNKDGLVLYEIDGINYSEFLIECLLRNSLGLPAISYEDHYGRDKSKIA